MEFLVRTMPVGYLNCRLYRRFKSPFPLQHRGRPYMTKPGRSIPLGGIRQVRDTKIAQSSTVLDLLKVAFR